MNEAALQESLESFTADAKTGVDQREERDYSRSTLFRIKGSTPDEESLRSPGFLLKLREAARR